MSQLDHKLIELWREAESDLGIRVEAPCQAYDAAGNAFECEVRLLDFGSPSGAYLVSAKTERRIRTVLRNLGDTTFVAVYGPQSSRRYKRSHIIDELEDFGWHGDTAPPDWFVAR